MSRAQPVRTCVGCRKRAAKSDLLRVVADVDGPARGVVPDASARRPGRGAHVHPVLDCLDLAERRRAFPRALRLEGPLDTSEVRSWITTHRCSSPEG
ncbi:MAG: YlxR family protein [Propionibacteriales bacterium]|nr:YlxR family protein [Propionibacteriales bacterium]